ncbi:ER lumen protein-retaining receptor B [Trebouxia sp. C0009 RCD-2024]
MNLFRLAGDMTHLLSVVMLLLKIHATRSCRGISLRTQELYGLVFLTRYIDIFFRFVSLYNTVMKLVFLASSATIIYYMRFHRVVRTTYDRELDTFRSWLLIVPCFLLALVINQGFAAVEILWAFSLYLEAVAILPQLVLLQRTQNIDNLTGNYILLLGAYRALYILNWIYKLLTEDNYRQWIVWTSGLVQTALYADFFYYYFRSWQNNEKLSLPT